MEGGRDRLGPVKGRKCGKGLRERAESRAWRWSESLLHSALGRK